jgi:hypothetical protein
MRSATWVQEQDVAAAHFFTEGVRDYSRLGFMISPGGMVPGRMRGGAVGFSYRKSFKAGPIRVTASKSGISYSTGVKAARITKRADGRVQTTLSAPGTGMRHTTTRSGKRNAVGRQKGNGRQTAPNSAPLPGHRSSALPYPPPAGTPPLAFKGYLATVTLLPDRIQIDRTFLGRVNGNHSASILWRQLAGVDFLDPARLINGHVHFATATDPRGLTAAGGGRRIAAVARNPRAIMFTWQQRATYERLRGLLTANQVPANRPAPPAPDPGSPAAPAGPRRPAGSPQGVNSVPVPPSGLEPAWLPGQVDVQVSGETFHAAAIREACLSSRPGVPDVAVLVPEPGNPHDHSAIAVLVNGFHVGYLSREIVGAVQPALLAFTASSGRNVACPARILWHEIDGYPVAQVILSLDPAPLGLPPEAFEQVPELDRVLQQHLRTLDAAAPVMTGCDPAARDLLAAAEALRAQADAEYGHGAVRWPRVEHAFRQVIPLLERARDPLLADAWAGLARSVRYQKGRRDDWIAAAVTSLYWDRANKTAWAELADLAAAAPHVLTLLDLFRRVPPTSRPPVLTMLINLSHGQDRLGNMRPADGERLRAGLAAMGESQGDTPTVRKLSADARKHQGGNR